MRLLPASFLLGLTLICGTAQAQTPTGNPINGKALFDNTRVSSGKPSITMNCTNCHTEGVEERRSAISANTGGLADRYADITFDAAMARFTAAITRAGSPMQQFSALDPQQVYDIAAYLADTPKTTPVSETQLNFSAALNGNSAAQTVTLRHATATSENLRVVSVAAVGPGAANFVVQKANCEGVTLTPGSSCPAVSVTYAPTTGGASTADLVFTLRQGTSTTNFERVLFLSGSIAGSTPPASDSGGGALGLGWLAALGLAIATLARRRG